MSKTQRHTDKYDPKPDYRRAGRQRQPRSITVRGIRRSEPDLSKLSRAVIALALGEAEAERKASQPEIDDALPASANEVTDD